MCAVSQDPTSPAILNGRLRCLFPHIGLFRVDAARPRLERALRTAPASRQTNPNRTLALTALSLTPCHPPSASVLSLSPFRLVSSRCRSSEERNKPETAEREKT